MKIYVHNNIKNKENLNIIELLDVKASNNDENYVIYKNNILKLFSYEQYSCDHSL